STDSRLAGTGISGWNGNDTHYILSGLDLSFLPDGTEFTSHFTMSCGNDNLMGNGVVAPEPGTLLFVGAGIVGLLGWRRRRAGDDC
ncbi:MAG: PEP-CTERM sorting domain-containing protein, partial [Deltaproteobacteria bacterium]|nr:PEP-CTERM sorting domain-containing protein [Candidatus Anaeroferrophillacea bacterium]